MNLYKGKINKNKIEMKRTTYIIIGFLILGVFLIPILLMPVSLEHADDVLSMGGESTEIELTGIRHVRIFEKQGGYDKDHVRVFGKLQVQATQFPGKSTFIYPKNKYLNVRQEGDCLLIEVNLDDDVISQITKKMNKGHVLLLNDLNLELKADSILLSIENSVNQVDINVEKISLDSLNIGTGELQKISLNSCRFRSLDMKGKYLTLRVNKVEVENYYKDLDVISVTKGEIGQFFIDNMFLTGRDSYRHKTGEVCKRIFWNPKSRDADLEIILKQKSEIILNR